MEKPKIHTKIQKKSLSKKEKEKKTKKKTSQLVTPRLVRNRNFYFVSKMATATEQKSGASLTKTMNLKNK